MWEKRKKGKKEGGGKKKEKNGKKIEKKEYEAPRASPSVGKKRAGWENKKEENSRSKFFDKKLGKLGNTRQNARWVKLIREKKNNATETR